ncbi:helix-turn-helix transcriptional regulator [Nonomuraea longicatena]|uniref:Helix-turn-helix domain-containing protein n=1 Tax=Nonomuraea longicatena TaxID=83682 RepID=A0ABP3ZE27_9ACTN
MRDDDLDAVTHLHDPVRRALYDHVVAQGGGVARGQAAAAVGVSRTLAAHHLDRLVEAGLLESGFQAPLKKGPGSGRPAKVYRRAPAERSVNLPPRDYTVVAGVLADVVETLGAGEQAERVARRAGERIGAGHAHEPVDAVLRGRGYEPYADGDAMRMRNCPFHALSQNHPVLVCAMNLALCQGLLAGMGEDPDAARMDPRPGECCVTLTSINNDD